MRPDRWTWARTGALTLPLILATLGCGEDPAAPSPGTTKDKEKPQAKAAEVDWCGGHGVPESICTRCNKDLIAGFQEKGDWCKEHGLPESQCIACHPDLEAKLKALAPKAGG